MGPVVAAILDRDDWGANTDIIVIVDPRQKQLLWIPRDLWSPLLGDRINAAFARGGGPLLVKALRNLGFACSGVLCLRRSATEAALATLTLTVPVPTRLDFWYPLHPTRPIEEGRKQISFEPPEEILSGERLHQWIGARSMLDGSGSDLLRLDRQQIALRAMLAGGPDLSPVLADRSLHRTFGRDVMPTLARIDGAWSMTTYGPVKRKSIHGKTVYVPANPLLPIRPLWWRVLRRLKRLMRR
jgi:hypothetical protein